ncbi:MAG: hypothetical protein H6718_17830 [Polyangiaceae bacterium]|nr:hypothetical protein [Polyangiaceae bacterium]
MMPLLVSCFDSGTAGEVGAKRAAAKTISLDVRRSLVVTEQPILARFGFQRVMEKLAADAGDASVTAGALFTQWWDTQNPGPGLGRGPHCDDEVSGGATSLNGYPYLCRPAPSEGAQSACDPFTAGSPCEYIPVGLFNRFDLAPEDASNCGEYRIVYAKRTGIDDSRDRNLVIFEAVMPNPHPQQGLKGCRKIVDVWADLTDVADVEGRADALEDFYFAGQGNVPPVVAIEHYGNNADGLGQIRTNQFSNTTTGWSLREFKLQGQGSGLVFAPVTVKTNPFGPLFAPGSPLPGAAAFQATFPAETESLAADEIALITLSVPDEFNSGQSQSSGAFAEEMRYPGQFEPNTVLREGIELELAGLSSGLTADDIVLRAQAQSCAGCHRLSNGAELGGGLVWPSSLGFTHVSERDTEAVDGVTRYLISPALLDAFLPHRKAVMEDYLNNKPRPPKAPDMPIGGRRSHG